MKPNATPELADTFRKKLKMLRPHLSITGLAKLLGQPKWQVSNWLYRDRANEWAVKALLPKMDKKIVELLKQK